MKKIIIIGAGAMGSAFAVPCLDNKNNVTIVGTHLEDSLIETINSNNHTHPALKTQLPKEIKFEKFNTILVKIQNLISINKQFGSPVYVYDANKIENQYNRLVTAFSKVKSLRIHYAAKALSNISILKFMKKLGSRLDTVSIEEVKVAEEKVVFKLPKELVS